MEKFDGKIAVLTKYRDVKNILFGQFSDTLTKEKKVHEWKNICEFGKALGLIAKEKDFSYARDVFWSNIKRATLAKKDKANKTGAGGGKNKKMTPLDYIVLEIIGKDSPILEGIGICDTMARTSSQNIETKEREGNSSKVDASVPCQNIRQVNVSKKYKRYVTNKSKSHEENDDVLALKRRKLGLQLEFIELQNYKMKLEIYELEERLNVSHSDFTNVIVSKRNTTQGHSSNVLLITQDNVSIDEDGTQTVYISSDHTGSDDTSNVL